MKNIEDGHTVMNRYVIPALVKLMKYIYDLDKTDDIWVNAVKKFISAGMASNDVKQNYTGMVACAA